MPRLVVGVAELAQVARGDRDLYPGQAAPLAPLAPEVVGQDRR